jgi:hypothetical protein
MSQLQTILDKMWQEYIGMNPQAKKIYDFFTEEGENVVNDHIALRTFNLPRVNVDKIAKPFLNNGYKEAGDYHFKEKKLYAKHYEHEDPNQPKIFISQLKVEEFNKEFQVLCEALVMQIPDGMEDMPHFVSAGRPWKISHKVYKILQESSEYAAWLSAWGYRPNHFTVFVNKMQKYNDLRKLNDFIKSKGISLNESGGEIKGSAEVFLEQSSTLANNVMVEFMDGEFEIPGCYYEFAQRYPLEDGSLYQGFVAKSADKIFESTDKGQ